MLPSIISSRYHFSVYHFRDKLAEDLFLGNRARGFPPDLQRRARMRLQRVVAAVQLSDLLVPQSHQLKALKGRRTGQHSIRINSQSRICFRWTEQGAMQIEVTDYH